MSFSWISYVVSFLVAFSIFEIDPIQPAASVDVEGYVFDAAGEPLVGVHAYLANTSFGTVTDLEGAFVLKDIPAGAYSMVASAIGFETKSRAINVHPDELEEIKIYLKEAVYHIPEITVVDKMPRRWKSDLERFKRAFLGKRYERKECDILNPYILDFERDPEAMYARAQEPLQVENTYLGYRVTYDLADFALMRSGEHRFLGYPYFEDLPFADESKKQERARRRQTLYEGSMLHFFRSAAGNTIRDEGFKVYVADGAYWKTPAAMRLGKVHDEYKVSLDTLFFQADSPEKRYLLLRTGEYLHVAYANEEMDQQYMDAMRIASDFSTYPQISVLSRKEVNPELSHPLFKGDTTLVAFNEMGYLYDQYVLGLYGYWNWESGVCDELPFNYGWEDDASNTDDAE